MSSLQPVAGFGEGPQQNEAGNRDGDIESVKHADSNLRRNR
jgi:hypothetical protein